MAEIPQFAEIPLDQLEALDRKLAKERDRLREEHQQVARALDARRRLAAATAKLAAMSPGERAAIAQVIRADGIDARSAVGAPGAGS